MKKIIIISMLLSAFIGNTIQAQSEVKFSPLFFTEYLSLSYEHGLKDYFGVEASFVNTFDETAGFLSGKYYMSTKKGLDGIYIGSFIGGYADLGIGMGFLAGIKRVSKHGILFEFGMGMGRTLGGGGDEGYGMDYIPYFKLDIGYRFGGKNK